MKGDLAKFVRRRREELGWTGAKLAEKLGKKSPSYVSKMEGDISEVSDEDAGALIDLLAEDDVERRLYRAAYALDRDVTLYEQAPVFGEERDTRRRAIEEALRKLLTSRALVFEPAGLPGDRLLNEARRPRDLSVAYDKVMYDHLIAWNEHIGTGELGTLIVARRVPVPEWLRGKITSKSIVSYIPDDVALKWYGPVSTTIVSRRVVVGSTGLGMVVSYDKSLVKAYLDHIYSHVRARLRGGDKPGGRKSSAGKKNRPTE